MTLPSQAYSTSAAFFTSGISRTTLCFSAKQCDGRAGQVPFRSLSLPTPQTRLSTAPLHLPGLLTVPWERPRRSTIYIRPVEHLQHRKLRDRHLSHNAHSAFAFSQCSPKMGHPLGQSTRALGTNLRRRSDIRCLSGHPTKYTRRPVILPDHGLMAPRQSRLLRKYPLVADAFPLDLSMPPLIRLLAALSCPRTSTSLSPVTM